MGEQMILDNEMVRVLDILEQVKKLNEMIKLHQENEGNSLMREQYEDMKQRFLMELKTILVKYQIEVKIIDQAA